MMRVRDPRIGIAALNEGMAIYQTHRQQIMSAVAR
jgi:hypothetical protein